MINPGFRIGRGSFTAFQPRVDPEPTVTAGTRDAQVTQWLLQHCMAFTPHAWRESPWGLPPA